MAEVGLQRAGIDTVVGQLIAAGMAQHVRVDLDAEIGRDCCPLDHAGKTGRRERRAAFRNEHERRRSAVALVPAERPHLSAGQGMRGRRAVLDAADMECRRLEVELLPSQVADLDGAQPVAEGEENHQLVAMAVAIVLRCLDQALDLIGSQMFAGPQVGIFSPTRNDCSIFSGWSDSAQVRFGDGFPGFSERNCTNNSPFMNSCER